MNVRRVVVVLALLLVAAGCSLPGSTTGPLTITATFDDVGDLVVNHSVQVADVRVGSVTSIDLTSDFKAKVTMSVKDVHLPSDAVAVLRQTSLLGEKFIELRPCDPGPSHSDKGCDPGTGTLQNHADIPLNRTQQAPELEFVTEQAVQLLGSVTANDVASMVQTGSLAFKDRGPELRSLIDDLSSVSATLSQQTSTIVSVIDNLDNASNTLSQNSQQLSDLLTNLSNATTTLSNNRDQMIATLKSLTNLAQAEDQLVFQPYINQVDRQVKEANAILDEITKGRAEVGTLVDWIDRFIYKVPQGVPADFAQVYSWFVTCPSQGC